MKSTVDQLTSKDRQALVHLYGTAAFDAIKSLCKLEIEGLGKDALISPNHEQTRFYSGQAVMAAKITNIIKDLHKEHLKNEQAKKKN